MQRIFVHHVYNLLVNRKKFVSLFRIFHRRISVKIAFTWISSHRMFVEEISWQLNCFSLFIENRSIHAKITCYCLHTWRRFHRWKFTNLQWIRFSTTKCRCRYFQLSTRSIRYIDLNESMKFLLFVGRIFEYEDIEWSRKLWSIRSTYGIEIRLWEYSRIQWRSRKYHCHWSWSRCSKYWSTFIVSKYSSYVC